MKHIRTCGIILFTLAVSGCRRENNAPAPATRPTTAPATRVTTTTTTQRSPVALTIDGKRYDFPPARITIAPKSTGLTLVLFSDDPAEAAADHANNFYFQMSLSVSNLDDLPSAKWRYKADKDFPADLPDGIFFDGGATQIQPADVEATFERDEDAIVVSLRGTFVDFGAGETATDPHKFQIAGKLSAIPE